MAAESADFDTIQEFLEAIVKRADELDDGYAFAAAQDLTSKLDGLARAALSEGVPVFPELRVELSLPPGQSVTTELAPGSRTRLGGKPQWDRLRGLRWTFGAEAGNQPRGNPRRHEWDKWTGWHRVEGTNRAGQNYVIIHNINDGKGMAWVAGTRIDGDSLAKLLARGKSTWINDSYWFLMPYKLRDPGVRLQYAGDTTVAGNTYDRLALSFDHVGETPGDHYWVYVNRKTQ